MMGSSRVRLISHRAGNGVGWAEIHAVKVHGLAGVREIRSRGIVARVEWFLSVVLRPLAHELPSA